MHPHTYRNKLRLFSKFLTKTTTSIKCGRDPTKLSFVILKRNAELHFFLAADLILNLILS